MADVTKLWKQGYSIASLESFTELATSKQCFADDKVCVVGLFGNGRSGAQAKAFYANSAVERNVFQKENFYKLTKFDLCEIEIYHDVEQRILYLHLVTVHDGAMLCKLCEALDHNIPLAESHNAWQHQEYQYAKAMLFMFSVCHIMVSAKLYDYDWLMNKLTHPTQTFDVSYIRLFKLVANTRQQLITVLCQELANVDGIHDIWKQTGRPCIPRLLCSFQQNRHSQLSTRNASEVEQNPDSYASRTKIKSQAPPKSPLTNLQHALEDQVYSIMRKSRLLGSLSSSSLFTVNSSHNFVHVQAAETSRFADPVEIILKKFPFPSFPDHFRSTLSPKPQFPVSNTTENSASSSHVMFRDFLREQIDNLMTGDGRDGLAEGRRGTHVEVPTIRQWAKVCVAVFGYLMSERSNENNHLTNLSTNLDLEMKFSDARCRKVLPVASSAYLDNLPSHYPQSVHMSQMTQALRVFGLNARGPACEKYAMQLQQECIKMWVNGRQLCEIRSLTGRHCIYPFHSVPGEYVGDIPLIDKSTVSCKPHSSRITSLSACNCGRTQAQREDPFNLKSANFDFYKMMEDKCCLSSLRLSFPYHPSGLLEKTLADVAHDVTPADQPGPDAKSSEPDEPKQEMVTMELDQKSEEFPELLPSKPQEGLNKDAKEFVSGHASHASSTSHVSHTSSVLSGGYHSISELESNYHKSLTSVGFHGNSSTDGVDLLSCETYQGETGEMSRKERISSVETADYLECMLSSEPTGGRLPLFSSWALCRLGNASTYQPVKGLEQPGFFPGSNFLLPWDIPLLNENQAGLSSYIDGHVKHPAVKTSGVEAWPAPNELPSASSNATLPLHQTLLYAARQCADYKANSLPICLPSTAGSKGIGSVGRNQRNQCSTVRAYVGNEYECPRGHRFICSAHDKMVKANNAGVVKETAVRLVNSDMPLYFPCPCRTSKPFLAQLTRLFVVTPESPVLITLNPRVQPAPTPCPIFYSGIESGVALPPASVCVLRLPFVYVGLEGPISPPSDSQPLLNSRLLKGTYGVMASVRLYDDKET